MPVTVAAPPAPVLTTAIAVLLLLHRPLPGGSLKVVADHIQMPIFPVIADGAELMATVAVVAQPAGKV
jgi:hypothetical protein